MQSLTKDELEEIFSIAREVARQEIEARLPIHKDIIDLKEAIEKLTGAQLKTEEKLTQLEEAQIGVQERVTRLEEATIRVQERLERLEISVEKLAEAQLRTEERLAKVEDRLDRIEAIVEKLAEAQLRTEERLNDLQKQVGGISHAIGFQLEDRAYKSLPKLLQTDFGIIVKEKLLRRFIKTKYDKTFEINIFGKAEKDGKELYIVGEAKTNLSTRHIDDFTDKLEELKEILQTELLPIMVTYMTEPEVYDYAKNKGIKIYYSYDFEFIT